MQFWDVTPQDNLLKYIFAEKMFTQDSIHVFDS